MDGSYVTKTLHPVVTSDLISRSKIKRESKKKTSMADLENSKWPPQKNLIFQLRQFPIFFHENFMDWVLG